MPPRIARFALVTALPCLLRKRAARAASARNPAARARRTRVERSRPARGRVRKRTRIGAAVSPGLALFLLVLFVLVALAGASFFRHTVAVLVVFLALPLGLVLKAAFGTGVSVFAIGLLAAVIAVIHTIADTLTVLRSANRASRKSSLTLADDRAEKSQSERSRIAA